MIGNTNGIYIPQGGGKTYIDLVPQIDITTLGTANSSAVYIKKEQHFWYSGNCNLEDYMQIQISKPNSSIKGTLKFKYRYLIPDTLSLNQYGYDNKKFCFLYNNGDSYNTISNPSFNGGNSTLSWHSFDMVLTEPSQISGMLILKADISPNANTIAKSGGSEILIKVTKGSTEVFPIYADVSNIGSTFYVTVLIQNVHD